MICSHCLLQAAVELLVCTTLDPDVGLAAPPRAFLEKLSTSGRQATFFYFFLSPVVVLVIPPKPDIYISTMSALLNRIKRRPSHEYGAISHEHSEQHFESAEIVRDTIIGLSGRLLLGRGGGRARVCFADFHLAHRWIDCTIRVGRWFVVLG